MLNPFTNIDEKNTRDKDFRSTFHEIRKLMHDYDTAQRKLMACEKALDKLEQMSLDDICEQLERYFDMQATGFYVSMNDLSSKSCDKYKEEKFIYYNTTKSCFVYSDQDRPQGSLPKRWYRCGRYHKDGTVTIHDFVIKTVLNHVKRKVKEYHKECIEGEIKAYKALPDHFNFCTGSNCART